MVQTQTLFPRIFILCISWMKPDPAPVLRNVPQKKPFGRTPQEKSSANTDVDYEEIVPTPILSEG